MIIVTFALILDFDLDLNSAGEVVKYRQRRGISAFFLFFFSLSSLLHLN